MLGLELMSFMVNFHKIIHKKSEFSKNIFQKRKGCLKVEIYLCKKILYLLTGVPVVGNKARPPPSVPGVVSGFLSLCYPNIVSDKVAVRWRGERDWS